MKKPYLVRFTGNDTFRQSIRVEAQDAMEAIVAANEIASKATIELFERVSAEPITQVKMPGRES